MRVHLASEPTTRDLEVLRAGLEPSIALSLGGSLEEPVDVLVTGRPAPGDLAQVRRALVIPYSGLPGRTRASLLAEAPDLPVYNLHHNAAAVAELAVGLVLAAARCIVPMDRALRRHDWRPRYAPDPSVPLGGETALVLGWGAIGCRVGRALAALGMDVQATRRQPRPGDPAFVHPADTLDTLLPLARVVVVCLPHTPETDSLLDAAALARLPPGAVLVNVARAAVVDEQALYDALVSGHLHGAGLDVWWQVPNAADAGEAPPSRLPFAELDQVVLSPHRAGHGGHVEAARHADLARTLNALAAGRQPPHRVDVRRGY